MRRFIGLTVFLILAAFSREAFSAEKTPPPKEKDLKTTVEELNYKYEKLLQLDYARHQQVLKELKDLRSLQSRKVESAPAPAATAPTPAATVDAKPVESTLPAATAAIPAVAPSAVSSTESSIAKTEPEAALTVTVSAATPIAPSQPAAAVSTTPAPAIPATPPTPPIALPEPVAGTANNPAVDAMPSVPAAAVTAPPSEVQGRETETANTAPTPVVTAVPIVMPQPIFINEAKAVKVVIPADIKSGISTSKSLSILSLLISIISLASMAGLVVTIRKSDERLRRMLWKSEVDHLRDEVMGGRPHLKVEKSFDRLLLTNTGTVAADDIKLSLGPAPATMKQRLRVLAKIEANEKAEVEIGPQTMDGQLYGTLEYKNPDNGRLYKDHFVLKVDGVTGEISPVQQAS